MVSIGSFTVTRVAPEDAEVIRGLRIAFVEGAPTAILGDPEYMRSLPGSAWRSLARQLAASDNQAGFLGWVEGVPVGLVQVSYRVRSFEVEITHLWVCREHRRKGAARKLLSAAVEFAVERNPRAITLWVTAGNSSAESLYQSVGFRYSGRTRPFEAGGDCLQLELALIP
jgi:ribosomal protein S18 acetylase RimI-like enzyme